MSQTTIPSDSASIPVDARPPWYQGKLVRAFLRSPLTILAVIVLVLYLLAGIAPDLIAPHKVFDLSTLDFSNAFLPPAWVEGGSMRFPLGTDDQSRDLLSAIIYGLQVSLMVGVVSVLLSLVIGTVLGLLAGYFGGWLDALIMRIADIQLTFPAILVAVLVDGLARAVLGSGLHEQLAIWVIVAAIALPGWVQYARTIRGLTMVVRGHNYVLAARLMRQPTSFILRRHILPNVATPIFVLATIQIAVAIVIEATLSFIGLGVPPTEPSLGTLIRIGNNYMLSGEWWLAIFPGLALFFLVMAINLIGDFLRDVLNPQL